MLKKWQSENIQIEIVHRADRKVTVFFLPRPATVIWSL